MVKKSGLCFSRSLRLTHAIDYSNVFKDNFRVIDEDFTLLVGKQRLSKPRLGLAVAKKQLKRAVDRNLIKRLIRESFRLNQHKLPNHDIVVMVRHHILKLNHQQIMIRLNKHWHTVSVKCEKF